MDAGGAGDHRPAIPPSALIIGGWPARSSPALAAIAGTWLFGDRTIYLAAPFALLWIASPAVARWVSRPSSAVTDACADAGRPAGAAADRAAHLALLRDLRHAGRQHASAGQFPGSAVAGSRPAHLADQSRPLSPVDGERARFRLDWARSTRSSGSRRRWRPWRSSSDIAAISTIGTIPKAFAPLDPQYVSSVDSGNLAGHLIALANACQDWCEAPIEDARRLAGIVDALSLVREEVEALRDRRRTETVTWRQLDEVRRASLRRKRVGTSLDGEPLAGRLAALAGPAEILVDLANAFAIERGEDASDILFWAQAVCGSIASHQRDLASSDDLATRFRPSAARRGKWRWRWSSVSS